MGVLRHLVAWPLAWCCFYAGDLCSKLLNLVDRELWAAIWYPVYNSLMIASSDLQDWAGGQAPQYPWSLATTES